MRGSAAEDIACSCSWAVWEGPPPTAGKDEEEEGLLLLMMMEEEALARLDALLPAGTSVPPGEVARLLDWATAAACAATRAMFRLACCGEEVDAGWWGGW